MNVCSHFVQQKSRGNFDVDSINSADFPLADFPHHNEGQSLSDALECLSVFCSSPKCGGLVLTEVNPDHDVDGSMMPTFTRLLVKALTDVSASSSSQNP